MMQFGQISVPRSLYRVGMIISVLWVSLCPATTLKKLGLAELTAESDTIVVGRCESVRTVWQDRKIYTIATVRVSESVKGACKAEERISVYILGGRVQKPMPVKMHVPGAAKVSRGEEMVLFLESRGGKQKSQAAKAQTVNGQADNKSQIRYRFVGMAQGKIPIRTDPKTRKKTLQYGRSLKGVRLVEPAAEGKSGRQVSKPGKSEALADFVGNIKRIMEKQKAEAKKAAEKTKQPDVESTEKKGGAQ